MPLYDCGDPHCAPCAIAFRTPAPLSADDRLKRLRERVEAIADDFHPDRDADAPAALAEMREALAAALSE